jgi:hypothetical protein
MRQILIIVALVAASASASADVYTTSYAGGDGGGPFTLTCPAEMNLVGIYGKSGGYVDRLGITCVKVYGNGKWVGEPTRQGDLGGPGGGDYAVTCPRDTAVTVIIGRASNFVDRLQIGCSGLKAGTTTFVSGYPEIQEYAVGGTAGTPFGPSRFNCANYHGPAIGFTGRYGAWVDKIALQCESRPAQRPAAPAIAPGNAADMYHHAAKVDWNAADGATKYQVCLTNGAQLGCINNASTKFWDNLSATELTLAPEDMQGFFGRTLKWTPRACNVVNCTAGEQREIWIRHPPAALVSPADNTNAAGARPLLQWTPVSGVAGYKVNISSPTDPWGTRQSFDVSGAATAQYTPNVDVPLPAYWSVKVCQSTSSCGFGGRVSEGTQRWLKAPTAPAGLGWATPITAEILSSIGHSGSTHLLNKSIKTIINSTNGTSGRTDGQTCSLCHFASASKNYRPDTSANNVNGIEPAEQIVRATAPSTTYYSWSQAAPNGIIDKFCARVGAATDPKPADLCAVFTKWRNDGYLP